VTPFKVSLAGVADLDLARRLARLRREVAEAGRCASRHENTQRSSGIAHPVPQRPARPTGALRFSVEPGGTRHHRPRPAERQ